MTFLQKIALVMVPLAAAVSATCGVTALTKWTAVVHPAFKRRFDINGAFWALMAILWFLIMIVWLGMLP
jgi:hypothetical protein